MNLSNKQNVQVIIEFAFTLSLLLVIVEI